MDSKHYAKADLLGFPITVFGAQTVKSRLLPAKAWCLYCDGTGEGKTSTYCSHYSGAGEVEVEACRFDDNKITQTMPNILPKKFEPRATFKVPPPAMRGLP